MAEDTHAAPPAGSSKKTIVILVAMLAIEAAVIVGAFLLIGAPAEVSAMGSVADVEGAEDEKLVEILVLDDRLPNALSGVTYIYDTEIYIQAKRKYEARIDEELDQFENEIRAEINAIWKTSDPRDFQEPMLETLTRKIDAMFNERFGNDQESGDRVVAKTVIVMGTGMRIDS